MIQQILPQAMRAGVLTLAVCLALGSSFSLQASANWCSVPLTINKTVETPGMIGYDQYLCSPGNNPDPIVSLAGPTGGSGTIEHLWRYTDIPGLGEAEIHEMKWLRSFKL